MDTTKLRRIKKQVQAHLLTKYEGVQAVGISEKIKGGKPQGRFALTVYVKRKISAAELSEQDRVDKDAELLAHLSVDDIDVKEIGEIRALAAWPAVRALIAERERRIRPIRGGYSEGHIRITAGTGSVIVVGRGVPDGAWFRLGNNHVLANSNDANKGDPVVQPGPYDGGRDPADRAGTLERWVPISFGAGINYVDAAIRTTQDVELLVIEELGEPLGVTDAWVGMEVIKSGRTTGVTQGIVTDVDLTVSVGYGSGKVATFEDQVLIVPSGRPFSAGGDSGSAIFETATMRWTALLFAGNESGSMTIANHAKKVMEELQVDLVPGTGEPPPPPPPGDGCILGFLKKLWPF